MLTQNDFKKWERVSSFIVHTIFYVLKLSKPKYKSSTQVEAATKSKSNFQSSITLFHIKCQYIPSTLLWLNISDNLKWNKMTVRYTVNNVKINEYIKRLTFSRIVINSKKSMQWYLVYFVWNFNVITWTPSTAKIWSISHDFDIIFFKPFFV